MKKPSAKRIYDVQEIKQYYKELFPDRHQPSLREIEGYKENERGKYEYLAANGEVITISHEYLEDGETIDEDGFYSSEFHKWLIEEFGDKNKEVEIKIWW